jgi:hypothetical protein
MTSQHTPGPWTFFHWSDKTGVTSDNFDVAHCSGLNSSRTREEEIANARLIAAAPDLLDALQDLFWAVTGFGDFEAQYPEEYAKARAAIAKARGE